MYLYWFLVFFSGGGKDRGALIEDIQICRVLSLVTTRLFNGTNVNIIITEDYDLTCLGTIPATDSFIKGMQGLHTSK